MTPQTRERRIPVSTAIAIAMAALSLLTAAVQYGRRDKTLDQKVDRDEYYRDIGQVKADLRVLRCYVAKDCP